MHCRWCWRWDFVSGVQEEHNLEFDARRKKYETEAADKDDEEELKALELTEKRILERGK